MTKPDDDASRPRHVSVWRDVNQRQPHPGPSQVSSELGKRKLGVPAQPPLQPLWAAGDLQEAHVSGLSRTGFPGPGAHPVPVHSVTEGEDGTCVQTGPLSVQLGRDQPPTRNDLKLSHLKNTVS